MKFAIIDFKPVNTSTIQGEKFSNSDEAIGVDATIYRSLIGSLLYMSIIRTDIMYATGVLSRFMNAPSEIHFKATKRVLIYIKGTSNFGVLYERFTIVNLIGFTNNDWGGSSDDMKSISSYYFTIGSRVICWNSKKQEIVAQSTTEAVYVAASTTKNRALWIRKVLNDLKDDQLKPTEIFCDSKFIIAMVKNPVFHGKTKHIKIEYHFLKEAEKKGEVFLFSFCHFLSQLLILIIVIHLFSLTN